MNTIQNKTALFFKPAPNPKALMRLVCFAYAGGSSATYLPWLKHLHPDVELVVCQLPGRGTRLFEDPYDDMEPLVLDLCQAIRPLCDKPLTFFGHSMGCKIAYELGLAMQKEDLTLPVHFIASAAAAPFHIRRKIPIHNLPETEFIAALAKLKGTPQQVLNNPEVMALFLPALRADFKLVETYANTQRMLLPTRLTLMGGMMDDTVYPTELSDWNKLFAQTSKIRWFEGDHFFINTQSFSVLQQLNDILDLEILRTLNSSSHLSFLNYAEPTYDELHTE